LLVIGLSILLCIALELASFPAAMLLGPMLGGAAFALRGAELHVPEWGFTLSKAVIGAMVARAITPATLATMLQDWPVMLLTVGIIVLSGALTGAVLARFGSLPGSTAAWGTIPGGAAAMTALAQAYGADMRMVAFMQYLRMSLVILSASVVSRLLIGHGMGDVAQTWSLGLHTPFGPTVATLALIAGGAFFSRFVRIPASDMLLPMIVGAVLGSTGVLEITVPKWTLWLAYACIGWYVGLRFTLSMVRYAFRAIPQLLLSTTVLIVLCCGAAWVLMQQLGLDVLSAYLSTSPGGLDTVAAIALSTNCDVAFILALQTLRLFSVIFVGPVLARLICRIGRPGAIPPGPL
jgi:membrane AbrB-like protein